jgi:formate dehydrogenase iron-sulfur subunit
MSRNLIALQNRFLGSGDSAYDHLAKIAEERGAITNADIEALAQEKNLPPAFLRTVAKFYDDMRIEEPSQSRLRLCNGEACVVADASGCAKTLTEAVDEQGSLGEVTCLGYCGSGPIGLLETSDQHQVFSLIDVDLEELAQTLNNGDSIDYPEPQNSIYPATGDANILLRHMAAGDVTSLSDAQASGVYTGLKKALQMSPEAVIAEVVASQLRGRGGAGFPAGRKLQTVADAPAKNGIKYIVVNADEGDAGAYIDKELFERDPHSVIEGTIIAAYAVGATEGYIYLRGEYPRAQTVVARALEEAETANLLGDDILGSGFNLKLKLVKGHGAYICGEETSLLRSLEGVPAQVSPKPPYPAVKGFRGAPTLVHNVESLATYPTIINDGGARYAQLGYGRTRGTKLISLNTAVKRPGLYEVECGTTIRTLIFDLAGGMAEGLVFKAVQIGGPLGGILDKSQLDLPLDFEAFDQANALLGHAGAVVFDQSVDLVRIGRGLMKFCAVESCGKCFPCRLGSLRGTDLFDKILEGRGSQADLDLLAELNETMRFGSLCALGGAIPLPMDNLLTRFIDEFKQYIEGAETPAALKRGHES